MTGSSRTVRARLDEPSSRALAILMAHGETESQVVRGALVAAAARTQRRPALAAEVARLADDPTDTRERWALMADMDALSPDITE